MPLDLPDGTVCFVDANVLYYHFVDVPPLSETCSGLLQRIAGRHITAYTSLHVLGEATHKIMVAAAAAQFALNRAGIVNWLQHHPDRIRELTEFAPMARELVAMRIPMLPADEGLLLSAPSIYLNRMGC